MFQHDLLKALFHNMAMTLLIERMRTRSIWLSVSLVFLELKQRPQKKGRLPRPYSTYIQV